MDKHTKVSLHDLLSKAGLTAERAQTRIKELSAKAYDAADPSPDPAVLAFSALALAYATCCRRLGVPWETAMGSLRYAFDHIEVTESPKEDNHGQG